MRILEEWEDRVGVVEVITGVGGIFDVHVDSKLVFSKDNSGRFPDDGEVLKLIRGNKR